MKHIPLRLSCIILSAFLFSGCDDGGGGGLSNPDPGENDVNVVVAFGDSITQGSECACPAYPARLAGLIGKTVHNTGVSGTAAESNVNRTQQAIDKYRPGFMLILYGVNDILWSQSVSATVAALGQMVSICEQNNVVPVLATYPEPIAGHDLFAPRVLRLNEAIRDLAESADVSLVDLEREFGADPDLYVSDGLHPNDTGTQIIAAAFADLF